MIDEIIPIAHWMFGNQTDATVEELASELLAVGLALRFIPHLNGFIHIQTNPKWCYSTENTVKNAESKQAYTEPQLNIANLSDQSTYLPRNRRPS